MRSHYSLTSIVLALTLFWVLDLHAGSLTARNHPPTTSGVATGPIPARLSPGTFAFTLPTSAQTSAGIYKKDGVTLVRTLWSNVQYTAGSHQATWDGDDDYGNPIVSPDKNYIVKVLSNNVKYQWEGVIGNSSAVNSGAGVHKAYYTDMTSLSFAGGYGFEALGYSERSIQVSKFAINNPQIKIDLQGAAFSQARNGNVNLVTTDGTTVYWAATDPWASNSTSYILATSAADDELVTFPSGVPHSNPDYDISFANVIDVVSGTGTTATGLAVQKSSEDRFLFVAHGGSNSLDVLNKTTGALVKSISMSNPTSLAVDANDELWIITGSPVASSPLGPIKVARYSVNPDGSLNTANLTLSGLVAPDAIAVSPDGTTVLVADSGSAQQIKAFRSKGGRPDWVLGTPGGYSNDPSVNDQKFYFNDARGDLGTFIAYAPDGSFWVNDTGNFRAQHYSSQHQWIERIMSLGASYTINVDKNDISRVFSGFMEFNVDYRVPISGSTGWTLVNNWGGNPTIPPIVFNQIPMLSNTMTLSNARTYGLVPTLNGTEVVEFQSSVPLRMTGVYVAPGTVISQDGSIEVPTMSENLGTVATLTRYPLIGFDGPNNPIWGMTGILLATLPPSTINDPILPPRGEVVTSSDKVVFYNPNTVQHYSTINGVVTPTTFFTGYHLGAVQSAPSGTTPWLWKTALADTLQYWGDFPDPSTFDIGNGVNQFAGSALMISGQNLITGYHGEFWKSGQTNEYNHYWDDGLAIGQFGITGDKVTGEAPAMMAGNALTPNLVSDSSGNLYLWHGDESFHAGVHCWKISGLNTISEQSSTIAYPITPTPVDPTDLMVGLPYNSTLVNGNGWTRIPATDSSASPWWRVETNALTYNRNSTPDITMEYQGQVTETASVSRSLGTASVSNSWIIEGKVAFPDDNSNFNGNYEKFLQVLDGQGRIILRFYTEAFFPGNGQSWASIYVNSTVMATDTIDNIRAGTNDLTNFKVSMLRGELTVQYGSYELVPEIRAGV